MTKREKFATRKWLLKTEMQRDSLMATLPNLPLDEDHPIEIVAREEVKARKPDQNALMWVAQLADISEQAWVDGKCFSKDAWHHHFKVEYLPEEYIEGICKSETYRKWDYTPRGERILVGSTTDLTVKGFSQYLTQIEADGANMGVQFHASPRERWAA